MKLIDGLAGESPASAGYPVGTVVISGDGAGDQTVGSPEKSFPAGLLLLRRSRLVFTGYLAATLQAELSKQLVPG